MAIRVTINGLLNSTALSGPKRITANYLATIIPAFGPKRITSTAVITLAAVFGPKRMTGNYVTSVVSIHNMFELTRLESSSVLYDFLGAIGTGNPGDHGSFTYELGPSLIPEHNPYRPRIPEQLVRMGDDYYDFYEENQNIHRQQHNITQMGDTTFPYQLFLKTHDDKQFTLGAVGRFYHEDFGIIQCRYVKFDEMATVPFAQSPVGLFNKNQLLDWTVTNDFTLSHPDLVIGISAAFTTPVNGTYGWVIVDGPNLQRLQNDSETAATGEAFAWSQTGAISNAAKGKVIGRRINRVHESKQMLPAQMWIRTESYSEAEIKEFVDEQTQSLQDAIDALQALLGQLPDGDELTSLGASITALSNKLNIEINQRKQADLNIQNQLNGLNFVTESQLNAAITNVINSYQTADAALQAQIDAIRLIALEALEKANSIPDWSFLQDQISAILAQMGAEKKRAKGRFPVVDGAIPPNLVYLGDGSLVYVETF
jgi:hypothetical protein